MIGVRHKVLGLAVCLAFITYLDRVCISVTAPAIMRDLRLTRVQMGFIFSAFTAAYALCEVPTGWWGDRVGPRRVLTRIVLWWSAFTAGTGAAAGFRSMAMIRFLFGAGEAGAWPNVAKVFTRWFPEDERGTAQGIFFMGAHLGGGITPLLVSAIVLRFSWRISFVLLGLPGLLWALVWHVWFRDHPAEMAVREPELSRIQAGRTSWDRHREGGFGRLFDPSVAAMCAAYFTQGYGFYFYITWLPTYLQQTGGLRSTALAILSGLPLMLSVVADFFGGITTDRLTRRYGFRIGRCAVAGASLFVAGLAMGAATLQLTPFLTALLISIAAASSNFLLGASWAACGDLAGENAGVVSAAMNTAGQIGGTLSPVVFAAIVERWGQPILALRLMSVLYLAGAGCWLWVRPDLLRHSSPQSQTDYILKT